MRTFHFSAVACARRRAGAVSVLQHNWLTRTVRQEPPKSTCALIASRFAAHPASDQKDSTGTRRTTVTFHARLAIARARGISSLTVAGGLRRALRAKSRSVCLFAAACVTLLIRGQSRVSLECELARRLSVEPFRSLAW